MKHLTWIVLALTLAAMLAGAVYAAPLPQATETPGPTQRMETARAALPTPHLVATTSYGGLSVTYALACLVAILALAFVAWLALQLLPSPGAQ